MNWQEYFLSLCDAVAQKSKDRSTSVGCIICGQDHSVKCMGYNGFPRGCDDEREDWHQRPKKYLMTAHAELNAVAAAARNGTSLMGCKAYVSLAPCAACTLALIQAGVVEITARAWPIEKRFPSEWVESWEASQELCNASNVKLTILPAK